MRGRSKLAALPGFAVWIVHSAHALACFKIAPELHSTDPSEVGVDVTPPEPPTITGVTVSRSYGPRDEGCGSGYSGSTCDGTGAIGIELADGIDDRTSPSQLGYRAEHVSGELPSGIELPGVVRARDGWIWLEFPDPGPDDQEEIDVTFRIVAVDLGGNESAASANVNARDPGNEGCTMAGRAGGSSAPMIGCAIVALLLRRRARPAKSS